MTRKAGQGEGTRPTKRADGRWAVAVTLPGSGARRWFYGKTRREAVEKLNGAVRDVQQGRPLPPGRLTVGQYLERWLETVRGRLRPSTHHSYMSYCHKHLVPRLGRHTLAALQLSMCRTRWLTWLLLVCLRGRASAHGRSCARRSTTRVVGDCSGRGTRPA